MLGIGAQPAFAHVSREHAELVVTTGDDVTSGRLVVHNGVVPAERAGAWAAGLLQAGCPATGSGVAGDNGGVPVVVELVGGCHVDALDLTSLIEQGGLTRVDVEFDGTADMTRARGAGRIGAGRQATAAGEPTTLPGGALVFQRLAPLWGGEGRWRSGTGAGRVLVGTHEGGGLSLDLLQQR